MAWSKSRPELSYNCNKGQKRPESTSTAFDGRIGRSTMAVTAPIAPPAHLIIALHPYSDVMWRMGDGIGRFWGFESGDGRGL